MGMGASHVRSAGATARSKRLTIRTADHENRYQPFAYIRSVREPDFNVKSFRRRACCGGNTSPARRSSSSGSRRREFRRARRLRLPRRPRHLRRCAAERLFVKLYHQLLGRQQRRNLRPAAGLHLIECTGRFMTTEQPTEQNPSSASHIFRLHPNDRGGRPPVRNTAGVWRRVSARANGYLHRPRESIC